MRQRKPEFAWHLNLGYTTWERPRAAVSCRASAWTGARGSPRCAACRTRAPSWHCSLGTSVAQNCFPAGRFKAVKWHRQMPWNVQSDTIDPPQRRADVRPGEECLPAPGWKAYWFAGVLRLFVSGSLTGVVAAGYPQSTNPLVAFLIGLGALSAVQQVTTLVPLMVKNAGRAAWCSGEARNGQSFIGLSTAAHGRCRTTGPDKRRRCGVTIPAEFFAGRVLAVLSRRSPGLRPPRKPSSLLETPQTAPPQDDMTVLSLADVTTRWKSVSPQERLRRRKDLVEVAELLEAAAAYDALGRAPALTLAVHRALGLAVDLAVDPDLDPARVLTLTLTHDLDVLEARDNLMDAASNFAGTDLTAVSLAAIDLAGISWDNGTRWPTPEWAARMRSASVEDPPGSGVFIVLPEEGRDFADRGSLAPVS
ncbi:hypothetical protein [Streptomyces sp. NPDC020951]|uniref:hypothetical protein n=1 Tax=Streptomyces sp. NPDC020951 TaxID=3365104 RepID=UPI0037AE45C9